MKARLTFFFLTILTGFISGCGDEDNPTPDAGTVTGTISPANAASKVYLIAGTDTIKGTPTAAGSYELTNVKAGTYSLAFKANDAYDAPAPSSVTVTARQTTTVPVATFTALPANGVMSVVINGVLQTGNVTYFGGNDYPIILNSNGWPNNTTTGHSIWLTLPPITGVGTYTSATQNPNGDEVEFDVANSNNFWWANYSMGTATVTVTSFNPTTKRISGTFSFTAISSGRPDKVGTNGILKNIKLMQ